MKFSEMKYERPDLDQVLAQCEEYAKKDGRCPERRRTGAALPRKKTP